MKWDILNKSLVKSVDRVVEQLLKNRGLKTKKEIEDFLNPKFPELIKIPKNIHNNF